MNIRLTFQEKEAEFRVGFEASSEFSLLFDESNGTSGCIPYDGSYDIIPQITAQILGAKDRHMVDDLLVREIPYHEVSNIQRGTTVIIA